MTGYERAVEYLRNRGGGAALNALVEEGYEGDGVDYDKLLEEFKRNDKAITLLPEIIADLQWYGQNKNRLSSLEELKAAAEQLLAWQPICSLGSSGDLRQKRLRKALDDLG
jgi:hypothetical protein